VALTNVVVRLPPFHCTVEVLMRLLPFTSKVNAALPAIAEFGTNAVIAGMGVVTMNVRAFDVPPPGAGFVTFTSGPLTL
jgi:hypothetical protein